LKKINEKQKLRGKALSPDLQASRYIDKHLFRNAKNQKKQFLVNFLNLKK
jgi:hypothetical protein